MNRLFEVYKNPIIRNYAVKTGQIATKIPLKNKTDAYIFTNNKSCEVFLLKGKSIIGGKGYHGPKAIEQALSPNGIIMELQKNVKKGVSVLDELLKSLIVTLPEKSLDKAVKKLMKSM